MNTKKRSPSRSSVPAREFLEKLNGGPLTFGQMIQALRTCDEMTQIQLAQKLRISRSHLCDIEKDRRFVSLERAAQFANGLGYPIRLFVMIAIRDQVRRAGLKLSVEVQEAA